MNFNLAIVYVFKLISYHPFPFFGPATLNFILLTHTVVTSISGLFSYFNVYLLFPFLLRPHLKGPYLEMPCMTSFSKEASPSSSLNCNLFCSVRSIVHLFEVVWCMFNVPPSVEHKQQRLLDVFHSSIPHIKKDTWDRGRAQ